MVIMITATASITKNVSVLPAALGIHGAITRMLAAMAAKMPTIHADGAGWTSCQWQAGRAGDVSAICRQ
jgi:hypothetical protein